jgi:hypothetical protein
VSPITRAATLTALFLVAAPFVLSRSSASAQAPTLPSDTLEANYGPPSEMAPMPEMAPSLPSDTIRYGAPLDETDDYSPATDSLNPGPAPEDSVPDETRSEY